MLENLKRRKGSRPSSPGVENVTGGTSTRTRLIGSTKAFGRGLQGFFHQGYLILIHLPGFALVRNIPNARSGSPEIIQGQNTPPIQGRETPPSTVHTSTGLVHNGGDTSQPKLSSTNSGLPYDGLSPWEEAILEVPGGAIGFSGGPTGGQAHKDFVDGLITEIRKYNTDIDNRRWFRINDKGEKVFFVEKVIFQLERYARIGDVAIQHNPDVVALVWAGFRFLLQIGSAYTKGMQTVTEGIELIVRSICECHFFERLYLGARLELGDELRRSIVKFYISVLRFLVYGKSYLSKSTADRVQESFSSELTQLAENMRTLLDDVKSKVNVVHMQWEEKRHDGISEELAQIRQVISALETPLDNAELKNTVERLYDHVEGKRRLDILQWISDVPFGDHHTFNSQRRQEDTGKWLLENKSFLEWRNSNHSSILWMRGDAGSGKTLLASFIIDEFRAVARSSNEHIMAYFYCDYKEPARSDRVSILRAIVKQLCLKGPTSDHIPNIVAEMYRRREEDGFSSGKLSVSECTELIVKLAGKYRDVTIVMDGIDECDWKTRAELFCAINDISKADSKVKIILTGRYDTDIERMFSTANKHYLTAKDNTADIIKYVETQVGKRCDPARRDAMQVILNGVVPRELRQEIIETLCEKSNGMFMWVHLQILALCEENTPGGIRQALKELPEDLNATYDQILKRITEKGARSETVANFVVRWLIYAESVCSTQSVIQAIAIRPGSSELDDDLLQLEIGHILGACQNLVVHDDVLDNFQFAHFSVKEYLQRHPRFADVETSQRMIAEVCLTAHVHHHSQHSGKRGKVEELLAYSTEHWPAHIRLSGDAGFHALRPFWIDVVGSAEISRFLPREVRGPSPLWAMCCLRLLPIAKYLLQRGDDPNCVNGLGETPLYYAVDKDHNEVVKMLVDYESVDINKQDDYGNTPLIWAAYHNFTVVAAMLLERGDIRVNEVSSFGATALTSGITNNSVGTVRLLLKRGDVVVNGVAGQEIMFHPLWHAVRCQSVGALELLLERRDIVMIRDPMEDNHTPLSWAQKMGYSEIAQLLSRRFGSGAGLDALPGNPGTALGAPREAEDQNRTDRN